MPENQREVVASSRLIDEERRSTWGLDVIGGGGGLVAKRLVEEGGETAGREDHARWD